MRADRPLPDVLVIGDSHSDALFEGCAAHGLTAEMLRFSGNFWHAGRIVLHPEHGLWSRDLPGARMQIAALRERLGDRSVLSPDVPVIASLGYHLGRIVPPFAFAGHVTEARHFDADDRALHASSALVDAYVDAVRGPHLRMARRMARAALTVFVAPPDCQDRPAMRSFIGAVTRRLRAAGLSVHDPNEAMAPSGSVLDARYVTPDGVHGNAAYGASVVGRMLDLGLIPRRPPR